MGEVQFEVISAAERVCVDALGHQRVHIVVVAGMFAKEASAWRVVPLGTDLELENQLP